jgi:hypothetical protein
MISRRAPTFAPLALLLVSAGVFLAAFLARISLVPHVVPISALEESQSLWALEAAFVLRALENIAAIGAVLVLVAVTVQWLDRQIAHRRGTNDPERSFGESDA